MRDLTYVQFTHLNRNGATIEKLGLREDHAQTRNLRSCSAKNDFVRELVLRSRRYYANVGAILQGEYIDHSEPLIYPSNFGPKPVKMAVQ